MSVCCLTTLARRRAVLGVSLLGLAAAVPLPQALAQGAPEKFALTLDRTANAEEDDANPRFDTGKLKDSTRYCVDLTVLLDGKTRLGVLTSEEGLNRRFNVDCRPGLFGRLPMGEGIEYFIQSDNAGKKVAFSAYPGVRTRETFNDVSCVYDETQPRAAVFRLRGFFTVLRSELPEQTVIELRPAEGTAAEAKACF